MPDEQPPRDPALDDPARRERTERELERWQPPGGLEPRRGRRGDYGKRRR